MGVGDEVFGGYGKGYCGLYKILVAIYAEAVITPGLFLRLGYLCARPINKGLGSEIPPSRK